MAVAVGADLPGGPASAWSVKRDCERAGYTDIAVTLALRRLIRREYVDNSFDLNERGEQYVTYSATDRGLDWLDANQSGLVLRRRGPQKKDDDDIPF